jgi:uncharacterized protein (DUF2062 family)
MQKEPTLRKEAKFRDRWVRWKRSLRLLYLRLMRLKGQPEEVAGGMAIGVFVGMTPTVPLHTVLAVAIAFLLKKSKLAAAVGVWIANPLILPLIYLLDYKLGRVITGKNLPSLVVSDFSLSHLIELGWEISYPMFIGGLVTGLILAIPSYFATKRVVILYREKRRKRSDKVDFSSKTT